MQRSNSFISLLLFLSLQQTAAQAVAISSAGSVMQAANPHLQAGGLHEFLFGSLCVMHGQLL